MLDKLKTKPEGILCDNGGQFKEKWKKWCRENSIEAHFAHPYYPQEKEKVERCIRNLNQEFVKHLRKFPEWLNGKVNEYKEWFNKSRFHRGINDVPSNLYECQVGNLT